MGRDSSCSMHTFQRLSNATIIILDFVVWTLLSCTKINDINEPLFRVLRFVVPNLPLDWLWNRYYYSHFPNALVCCNVYQHYSAQSQSKVTFSPPTNVSETQNHQIRDTDRLSRKWWWTINHCTKKTVKLVPDLPTPPPPPLSKCHYLFIAREYVWRVCAEYHRRIRARRQAVAVVTPSGYCYLGIKKKHCIAANWTKSRQGKPFVTVSLRWNMFVKLNDAILLRKSP